MVTYGRQIRNRGGTTWVFFVAPGCTRLQRSVWVAVRSDVSGDAGARGLAGQWKARLSKS